MKPATPPFQRGGGFGTLGSSFEQPTLPEPVSWAPATVGAWLGLGLVAAGLVAGLALAVRRFRRRAPRRAALHELAQLELRSVVPAERAASLERAAALLKITALDSFGRTSVASLSGERWRAFLVETAPRAGFDGPAGVALLTLSERGASAVEEWAPFFVASRRWLRQHHVAGRRA